MPKEPDFCFFAPRQPNRAGQYQVTKVERTIPGCEIIPNVSHARWVDAEADAAMRNVNHGISDVQARAMADAARKAPTLPYREKDVLSRVFTDSAGARSIADDLAEADHSKRFAVIGEPGYFTIVSIAEMIDIDTVNQVIQEAGGTIVHITPKRTN